MGRRGFDQKKSKLWQSNTDAAQFGASDRRDQAADVNADGDPDKDKRHSFEVHMEVDYTVYLRRKSCLLGVYHRRIHIHLSGDALWTTSPEVIKCRCRRVRRSQDYGDTGLGI